MDKFQENEFNNKVSANFELKILSIFLVKSRDFKNDQEITTF